MSVSYSCFYTIGILICMSYHMFRSYPFAGNLAVFRAHHDPVSADSVVQGVGLLHPLWCFSAQNL